MLTFTNKSASLKMWLLYHSLWVIANALIYFDFVGVINNIARGLIVSIILLTLSFVSEKVFLGVAVPIFVLTYMVLASLFILATFIPV